MERICIIGGGVIGLTSAYYLAQRGLSVTVLEQADDVAQAASRANGGQLSYSYVSPLADAGMPMKALGWMLKKDAPMRLKLRADPRQWAWLWQFLRVCNVAANRSGTARLWQLAQHSRALMQQLRDEGLEGYHWRRNGKLVIFRQAAGFETAQRLLDYQRSLGAEQRALDGNACLELEPALQNQRGRIAGGIHTPSEEVADCRLFCLRLKERIALEGLDVRFCFGETVTGFECNGQWIDAVLTKTGRYDCDAVVLAAGVGSVALGRQLGLRLPLYPLKGYSLDMPLGSQAPRLSVTDFDNKVLYAPIGERLRVAAMVDLVGFDNRIDRGRIDTLTRLVRSSLPQSGLLESALPWAGLRPATPSGVPMIGRAGPDNLWLNLGHGALGFTLAAGSGELLARQLLGRPIPPGLDGLQPAQ
ncbi:D-amino acid dehydrogenase [Crenobacter sp. SG2303]|uniref:D-amino acid dehydrogenase n=1 Tax=Crenobacter oryzisoli TaxID=3056844 RepID=A0ABT7XP11_9NEIS|nr:D-amino acid dehydrogenase [Crenobacter sp. SG2303]MDN0075544.1 D-amino acid dehydrogenase [Crenobacter sp. SG2303]